MLISASEGYADAFRLLYIEPEKLIKTCPDVYDFVFKSVNKLAPNKGNIETFDNIYYADRYSDLKEAFGYDKEALYNHYTTLGIKEGRIALFK